MRTAALGRGWDEAALAAALSTAGVEFERAGRHRRRRGRGAGGQRRRGVVPGPFGVRPARAGASVAARRPASRRRTSRSSTTSRAASSSGRWRRWCWPSERHEIFCDGPLPVAVHALHPRRAPGVARADPRRRARRRNGAHPDGRPAQEPLVARMLERFEARTGVPVVVNTSLNTAGRPMVDDPRDALECFGSSPVDALAIGPYLLHRAGGADVRWRELRRSSSRRPAGRRWRRCSRRSVRTSVIVVDDRRDRSRPLRVTARVIRGRRARPGGGAQRRAGARARAEWVAFLDDDVVPPRTGAPGSRPTSQRPRDDVAGVQGADRRAAAPSAPDRLGAQRRRPGARALGDRRHGLPPGGAGSASAASTSASRAPTARTPTSACA